MASCKLENYKNIDSDSVWKCKGFLLSASPLMMCHSDYTGSFVYRIEVRLEPAQGWTREFLEASALLNTQTSGRAGGDRTANTSSCPSHESLFFKCAISKLPDRRGPAKHVGFGELCPRVHLKTECLEIKNVNFHFQAFRKATSHRRAFPI